MKQFLGFLLITALMINVSATYPIFGRVINSQGYGIPDVNVTAINIRTGDALFTTTNNYGFYFFDASNFQNGFQDGDSIKIEAGGQFKIVTINMSQSQIQVPDIVILNQLTVSPPSIFLNLTVGSSITFPIVLVSQTSQTVFISSDIDFISLPSSKFVHANIPETVLATITPDEAGEYSGKIKFTTPTSIVSIPVTINVQGIFYKITDDWYEEDDTISFGDYTIRIIRISDDYVRVKLYENDELIKSKRCYSDEITYLNDHIRVKAYNLIEDERARLLVEADEQYQLEEPEEFKYIIFENMPISTDEVLDFDYGKFYLYPVALADTGVRFNYCNVEEGYKQGSVNCFIDSDCIVNDEYLIRIISIHRDEGKVTLTIQSKNRHLATIAKKALLPLQKQSQAKGGLSISMIGKVAPNKKVIFTVTDGNYPVKQGTLIFDVEDPLTGEPLTADIAEGLATVKFPETVECPIVVTAIVPGYPKATQVFTSCSEEALIYSTKPKIEILTDKNKYFIGDDVTFIVKVNGKTKKDVNVEIITPSETFNKKTDEDGEVRITCEEAGDIIAKAGNVEKKISCIKKELVITLSNPNPQLDEDVYVTVRDTSGNIVNASITLNGIPIQGPFNIQMPGTYTLKAVAEGYEPKTLTFTVEPRIPSIVSAPSKFEFGKEATIELNKPADWKILLNNDVIAQGHSKIIRFTPIKSGTYTLIADDAELLTTTIEQGLSIPNLMPLIALAIVIAIVVIIKYRKEKEELSTPKAEKKEEEITPYGL